MRTSMWRSLATLSVVLSVLPATRAGAQQVNPDLTVAKSLEVLSEITRNPRTGLPPLVMRDAHAIAVIPDTFKASFIFGARFGRGVLVVRQPDGTWSNPLFINLFGGSFGLQAGAQATDMVLVFQTRKGLERFLQGKGKLTLGVDAGVAAGPVGKRFEASTDLGLRAEILSYSNSRGIFAGVSAEGGTLQIDWRANVQYYRKPVSAGEILAINSPLTVPQATVNLKRLLAEKTAWPARVVRTRPAGAGEVVVEEGIPWDEDSDIPVEIDGAIPREKAPRATPENRTNRPPSRGQAKPRAPLDEQDDLDAIPPPRENQGPKSKSASPNDEDLPEAAPAKPSSTKTKKQTRPQPPRSDDEIPELQAPKTASARRSSAWRKVKTRPAPSTTSAGDPDSVIETAKRTDPQP